MNRLILFFTIAVLASDMFGIGFAEFGPRIVMAADDATARLDTAKNYFDSRQYDLARAGYEDFLAKYPTNDRVIEAMFYRAESYYNLPQYDPAATIYGNICGMTPKTDKDAGFIRASFFRYGEAPYLQEKFDVAKTRFENFIDRFPNDANLQFVLYYLGDIAVRNGIPDEADHYFTQSVAMFPTGKKFYDSQLGLAWAKNHLEKTAEADQLFQQVLSTAPAPFPEHALYQWGVAMFERGNYKDAVNKCNLFQTTYRQSVFLQDSFRVLARSSIEMGDYTAAIQTLNAVAPLTTDDQILKVRALYGNKQVTDAQTQLSNLERTAGPAYADEITLLKSVMLYDQMKYTDVIRALTTMLVPQFDAAGRMAFGYLSLPTSVGGKKLNEESFLQAGSLLALSYGQTNDSSKANAILNELQDRVMTIGDAKMRETIAMTQRQLNQIYQNGSSLTSLGPIVPPGSGSWSWGTGSSTGSSATGIGPQTELDQYRLASTLYDLKNWTATVQTLESLLVTQYSAATKVFSFNYRPNTLNPQGMLDSTTSGRACSLLILSYGQLGDTDKANAALSAFAAMAQPTNLDQQVLVQQTRNQLAAISVQNPGTSSGSSGVFTETEFKRQLRETQNLFTQKKYESADERADELIRRAPSDTTKAEAMLLRGKVLFAREKDRESRDLLVAVTTDYKKTDSCGDALYLLGLYYENFDDSESSSEYFQRLVSEFPNSKNIDGALYFLALYDLEYGDGNKANTYLSRVYRSYQNGKYWSHVAWTLAYEAYKKGNYTQSEDYLQRLLNHPPDRVIVDRALYLKGELSLLKNDYERALLAFRSVNDLCPDSPLFDNAMRKAQIAANSMSGTAIR